MLIKYLQEYELARWWAMLLLLLLPLIIWFHITYQKKKQAAFMITTTHFLQQVAGVKSPNHFSLVALRSLGLAALIIAFAGPQKKFSESKTIGEGIDIMLCFDISGSMTESDFEPNRLEASKLVATQFVQERPGDRIGVAIFSRLSYTLCPLTTDHNTVLSQIKNIQSGYLQEDGTAIGSGIATSVDRLRAGSAKSRIVILLTDGVDFGGTIPPDLAIQMAIANKVKIYTIGVGTDQEVDKAVKTQNGTIMQRKKTAFNESLLQQMASVTGGQYFHASDKAALTKIYANISQLEKSKVEVINYNRYEAAYFPFLLAAFMFILLEILLRLTYYRQWP